MGLGFRRSFLSESEPGPARRSLRDARGFSLMEAIVATVIAVIAALGLAYTFGIGRSNINRFEVARSADAVAQARIELLGVLAENRPASDSLHAGAHPSAPIPFRYRGRTIGSEYWRVEYEPPTVPGLVRTRLSRVTAVVTWTLSGLADSTSYTRLVARP